MVQHTQTQAVPRIGVTGMWSNQVHGLRFDGSAVAGAVLKSVIRAGGEPHTLFALSSLEPAERLVGLDALLVPGGADVAPARYGEAVGEATLTADFAEQDEFEAGLLAAAIEMGLPVLAICRGFQLLNVEQGGSLVQDVAPDSMHRNSVHDVTLEPDSRMADVLAATQLPVSSYHHQAIGRIGADLRVVGRAPDGVVEAFEHVAAPVLAMQWHPEDTAAEDGRQQALFDWLVTSAQRYREEQGR
ncbi:gamma-glutamyl-gamma-aminobutyrate hydrolase family protein [Leucobacter sp. cx-328]|uniref:gamma-glutamyl-gamma-aminobutyrate hydrolase family protein n=1 Tax=unclassified Leucobacter TaxID=2621730 RepID=UPI00165E9EBE|nr:MULTISPECIES: gamma-glutamyl-gamma-aminobutyrate hydrolase family protein [unclassified Leucobacter]MBC9943318.1 gamma-glutamyl-gamma-aminobutyrate hydrolase family protein [Leucobacter sp. cx-328]